MCLLTSGLVKRNHHQSTSLMVGLLVIMMFAISDYHASDDKLIWNSSQEVLRAEIDKLKELAAIEGISAGFTAKDHSITTVAIGFANSEIQQAVEDDTIFQAASLSKPLLAFLVLKMADRGDIDLDTPLHTILENDRIENKEWGQLITPRLVLSHQTGLPNWGGEKLEFNFKPGSGYNYSGEGYVYLQKVLEKMTGLTYQELAVKEVFKPLGMTNSYFTWSEDQQLKLALGHDRAGQQNIVPIPESNAAASLHTTAADYLKFMNAWFDPQQISAASRKLAFTPATDTSTYKAEPKTISWGLGWGMYNSDQTNIAWHWGDNGIFRSFVLLDPKNQRGVVYFTNSENGLAISEQVTELFFPGNPDINDWLGYGQADSDIWQAERMGYVYASKGAFEEAIKEFNVVLDEYPDNGRIKNKINWILPLAENRKSAVEFSPDYLQKVVGQYDERRLFIERGELKYQRGNGQVHTLTPLFDQFLKVGELQFFRLEIVMGENGTPAKLIGHYEGGFQDESPRSSSK